MTGRRLDELTTVVLAPNPSAMTLEGTNTYLIGAAGSGEVMLVGSGPRLPAHRAAIDAALAVLDATVATVVVTHHHNDHAEAAGRGNGRLRGLAATSRGDAGARVVSRPRAGGR